MRFLLVVFTLLFLPLKAISAPKCSKSFVNLKASDKCFSLLPLQKKIPSKTGKALVTHNRLGFDTVNASGNWVTDAFIEQCKVSKKVLDVGAGYGAMTRKALELNKSLEVISNDLSYTQLVYSQQQTPEQNRDRLILNSQKFPQLTVKNGSLDAVIMHRMLHFLSGKEIESSFKALKKWLKPKGRVYVVTISPHHILYRETFTPGYLKREKEGVKWPGEFLDVKIHLSSQAYGNKQDLHPLGPNELERALKENGFRIIKSGFISMKKFGQNEGRDGKEAVGVIAEKI